MTAFRLRRLVGHTVLVLATLCLMTQVQAQQSSPDVEAIKSVLNHQFARPESSLQLEPVSVVNDYAMVGWIQGDAGGRALMKKKHGHWQVILCAGDGLKSESALVAAGMLRDQAHILLAAQEQAEAAMPAAQRNKLSLFQGVVNMEGKEHAK